MNRASLRGARPGARRNVAHGAQATARRAPRQTVMSHMPRPCVVQINRLPSQMISYTGAFVGPSLVGDQLRPLSSLAKSPISVPA